MIRKAEAFDLGVLTRLALALWPGHEEGALYAALSAEMADENACFALAVEDGQAVGFAQCQLRFDYVEGAESSPVGYLEGIYVEDAYRRRGIADALLRFCEAWAGERGCTEFASDCALENTDSLRFHLRAGFAEVNRVICFLKKL